MRLWLEVAGFIVTVIGCLIGFYQLIGPTLRTDERKQLAIEIADALKDQGVTVPDIDTSKPRAEIARDIASAVAEVRELENAFELAAGQSKEVTDHGILVTNIGVRASGGVANHVAAALGGTDIMMKLGVAYPLPAPAENCTVQVVGLEDWPAMWGQRAPDKATFRVKCQ